MSDFSQGPGWWQASDGKWYPPQPGSAPPQPPIGPPMGGYPVVPPQKQGMSGCLKAFLIVLVLSILAGIAVVVVAAVAVDNAVDDLAATEADELDDVEIVDCRTDDLGSMVADVRIENNSADRSNYFIDVEFVDDDGDLLGTAFVSIDGLETGQGSDQEANSFVNAPEGEDFECEVQSVERFSDEFSD